MSEVLYILTNILSENILINNIILENDSIENTSTGNTASDIIRVTENTATDIIAEIIYMANNTTSDITITENTVEEHIPENTTPDIIPISEIIHTAEIIIAEYNAASNTAFENLDLNYSSTTSLTEVVSHSDHIVSTTYKMGGSSGLEGKENQDAYSINQTIELYGNTVTIVCGCDGHGFYGKFYSFTTVNEFSKIIIDRINEILDNPSLLYHLFETFNESLKDRYEKLYTTGGTTITLLIKIDGCQIVANLADFDVETYVEIDASNITLTRDGIQQEVTSNFMKLTGDHSPHSIPEVERLLDLGCSIKYDTNSSFVEPINAYNVQLIDGIITIRQVPHTRQYGAYTMNMSNDIAMYIHQDSSKLNLSRSFGDFRSKFVIARPTITIVKYPVGTKSRTILGSDGYFNCLTKAQLHEQLLLEPIQICSNSFGIVDRTFGHRHADNMTVIALDN